MIKSRIYFDNILKYYINITHKYVFKKKKDLQKKVISLAFFKTLCYIETT